MSLNPKL